MRKYTIDERWEQDIDHDPRSVALYKAIAKIDFEEVADCFNFKSGGGWRQWRTTNVFA